MLGMGGDVGAEAEMTGAVMKNTMKGGAEGRGKGEIGGLSGSGEA